MSSGGGLGPNGLRVAIAGSDDAILNHIALWQRVPGARVAAFSDADRERLLQAVELAPEAAAFTSEESLLNSGLFSALDLCAASADHVPVVISALAAGFDLLCRAPASRDPAPAQSFAAAPLRHGQVFIPAQTLWFHPACIFLHDLIENDDLGGALRVQISVCASQIPEAGDSVDAAALAAFDLFGRLAGSPCSARAVVAGLAGAPDAAAIAVTSPSGAIGSILATCGRSTSRAAVTVSGSAGSAAADLDTGLVRYCTAEAPVWVTHDAGVGDPAAATVRHFADCIRGDTVPLCTAQDAADAAHIWAAASAHPEPQRA